MDKVEQWRDIPHYEGLYQISTNGRIWSVRRQRYLKTTLNKCGYEKIVLTNAYGQRKEERVHRLVALAWIPNPNHYPVINHINEIKTDNRVENLEWCTSQYNTQYSAYKWSGSHNGMNKPGVREKHQKACEEAHEKESIKVYDTLTNITYKSLKKAEKETNISRYKIKHSDRFELIDCREEVAAHD